MSEPISQPDAALPMDGFAAKIEGDQISFGPGFAVQVTAKKDVTMSQAGALVIAAGANMDLSFGGSLVLAVGHDQQLTNGGALQISVGNELKATNARALMIKTGGAAQLKESVALVAVSPKITTQGSLVGVLISPHARLGEGTRVLLNTR
jgi:hypothetical protein